MFDQDRVQQLRSELESVVDRIVGDPAYRRELLENPHAALVAAGLDLTGDGSEVVGYVGRPACAKKTCGTYGTCGVSCSHASPKTCTYTCKETGSHTTLTQGALE